MQDQAKNNLQTFPDVIRTKNECLQNPPTFKWETFKSPTSCVARMKLPTNLTPHTKRKPFSIKYLRREGNIFPSVYVNTALFAHQK